MLLHVLTYCYYPITKILVVRHTNMIFCVCTYMKARRHTQRKWVLFCLHIECMCCTHLYTFKMVVNKTHFRWVCRLAFTYLSNNWPNNTPTSIFTYIWIHMEHIVCILPFEYPDDFYSTLIVFCNVEIFSYFLLLK